MKGSVFAENSKGMRDIRVKRGLCTVVPIRAIYGASTTMNNCTPEHTLIAYDKSIMSGHTLTINDITEN